MDTGQEDIIGIQNIGTYDHFTLLHFFFAIRVIRMPKPPPKNIIIENRKFHINCLKSMSPNVCELF